MGRGIRVRLLHGMGFANGLTSLGLEKSALLSALILFQYRGRDRAIGLYRARVGIAACIPLDEVRLAAARRADACVCDWHPGRLLDLPLLRHGARTVVMRKPGTRGRPRSPLRCCSLAASLAASAHLVTGEGGGFVSGLQHPVSGLDHIIAMVAVGLWGAQLGRRRFGCCR